MTTIYEVSCTDCDHIGRYQSQALADHHFARHSCTTNHERAARAERRAQLLASAGDRRDCPHPAGHQHGTRTAYVLDRCRCHPCKVAARSYEQQRRRDRAYGRSPLSNAEDVRQHLRRLMAAGMGWKRIAAVAGVAPTTVGTILYGRGSRDVREQRPPRRQVKTEVADRLLAVQLELAPGTVIPGAGTVRRLQALVAVGWSQSKLAARLNVLPANFGPVVHGQREVTVRTAAAVRDLYDQLWNQQPSADDHRDRIACSRSLRYAAEHGWVPPLAWDDDAIDDPAAQPSVHGVQRRNAVVDPEDVEMLLDVGHTRAGLTARLGLSAIGLQRALERQDRPDLWRRIVDAERVRREFPRRVA